MMARTNGCGFGRETRQMVKDIKECVRDIKDDIKNMSNHYSKRLPHWATITITLLASLTVGLIINALK